MLNRIKKLSILMFCLATIMSVGIIAKYNEKTFEQNQIIDLSGNNMYWKASLNISMDYNSELIIQPRRNDFLIPPEITANIIEDEEIIYSVDLQYIPHESNPRFLGRYVVYFDSGDYFKHNIEEVILNITYNDNDISILLERSN